MKTLKILGVHGLGDHRTSTWKEDWTAALKQAVPGQQAAGTDAVQVQCDFVTYDEIFANVDLTFWDTAQAVWKLARSGLSTALGKRRGVLSDVSDRIKWTAGYVVAWVENEKFKRESRKLVLDAVARYEPDVICAHSLGTLVTYDAFADPDAAAAPALRRARYLTLGSQLNNAFVVGNLAGGRLGALPVSYWYHLFNENDQVFTAPIQLWDMRDFQQVETPFDIDGFADHSAVEYLKHPSTIENVWRPIVERQIGARGRSLSIPRERPAVVERAGRSKRRALLVGINQYPREEDRLDGCVNDVFLMSSVLQECGFEPESIRVCLDERATAKGITERLKWLLDDPRPGDERLFFYSGHGATIPEYGENFEPDRKTETLVPWDFDWSQEHAVIDDQIFRLYSQLPYSTRFAMILDCCHSGGMHRQGGARVRGLNPPDDIRHRELKWDLQNRMWVDRKFKPLNDRFSPDEKAKAAYFGTDGASTRIGRASLVRSQSVAEYGKEKRRAGSSKVGPYLPLILEACQEDQLSYEYRHGVTSYGAFTYSLALELREKKRITFDRLVDVTAARLKRLGYDQRPQVLGPRALVRARVPWTA
jgi:hypothetical protein